MFAPRSKDWTPNVPLSRQSRRSLPTRKSVTISRRCAVVQSLVMARPRLPVKFRSPRLDLSDPPALDPRLPEGGFYAIETP